MMSVVAPRKHQTPRNVWRSLRHAFPLAISLGQRDRSRSRSSCPQGSLRLHSEPVGGQRPCANCQANRLHLRSRNERRQTSDIIACQRIGWPAKPEWTPRKCKLDGSGHDSRLRCCPSSLPKVAQRSAARFERRIMVEQVTGMRPSAEQ